MKIAVIHGGTSTEQAYSTANADDVDAALRRLGHETTPILYREDMIRRLRDLAPDLAFICVQGKGHGDGTVQAVLDFMGIPYTGSRTLGAAIINDKIVCKELFCQAGARTPRWRSLSLAAYRSGAFDFASFGYPFMAKAPSQGYDIGVELIRDPGDLAKIGDVFVYDDPICIEQFIPGYDATVGLLEEPGKDLPLAFPPVGHVEEQEGAFYSLIKVPPSAPLVPLDLPEPLDRELRDLARISFAATRAGIYARVDFRVSIEDGLPYILEINAVPGLKAGRSYSVGAGDAGIDYQTMIQTIVQSSLFYWKKDV